MFSYFTTSHFLQVRTFEGNFAAWKQSDKIEITVDYYRRGR